MNLKEYSERLRYARKQAGMIQETLAEISGVSQSTISKIERGLQLGASSENNAMALALGVKPEWLSHNVQPMKGRVNVGSGRFEGINELAGVPLIEWYRAFEWYNALSPEHIKGYTLVPCFSEHSENAFALKMTGDSMEGGIRYSYSDGDILLFDPDKAAVVRSGDRVLAVLDNNDLGPDERTVFKVYISDGGQRYLQSLNPRYADIRGEFSIIAKFIGRWSD